jgi:hypothetical protein
MNTLNDEQFKKLLKDFAYKGWIDLTDAKYHPGIPFPVQLSREQITSLWEVRINRHNPHGLKQIRLRMEDYKNSEGIMFLLKMDENIVELV